MRETSKPIVEKVAIIGAGPGGLATAIALRKQGIDAHVYEKAKEFRPVGAGLGLMPNGLKCLDAIQTDILNTLKNSGCQLQKTTLKTISGETIRTSESSMMAKYGQPTLTIWWWRLQQILASFLPPNVIHLNHRCIDFEQNENNVVTYFENGKTAQADLLIGADGANSVVRQKLIGDGEPQYLGSMSWRAVLDYKEELLPPDEAIIMKGEDSLLFIFNLGEGNMNWIAQKVLSEASFSTTPAETKSRVVKEYANWNELVQKVIEATNAERILETPICQRLALKQWSYGRVTLLGDAAHLMPPSSGQGTNTTFEDAYELAECLANFPDLETALNTYDKRRIQRTAIIQTRSAKGDKLQFYQPSQQTKQKSPQDFQEFQNWVYDYDPKSESRLKPWKETVVI
ncbi:NAD(P)/FAD-dependent oxidoreductase [Okeania sp. SIO2B9]|uniref:FAD-dependent oxidoreductase n=1 Tax=Okeania sp. SIO2B9 TaxID=2607782 RepID=UPI00142A97EC|nr:FAD-dependent monooxygenase [Okeania sp. SIO2B9]NES90082.1 NAD(P)-binding protein [Okeania sp. SIO2B9]